MTIQYCIPFLIIMADDNNEEEEIPNLLGRLTSNDPTLTQVVLDRIDEVGPPDPRPEWWGGLDEDPSDWHEDDGRHEILNEQVNKTIEALMKGNTTITSVSLDSYFGYSAGYSGPYKRLLHALIVGPTNLEEIDFKHQYWYFGKDIVPALREVKKLKKLKLENIQMERDDFNTFIDILRGHAYLTDIDLGHVMFENTSVRNPQALLETLASRDKLEKLELLIDEHYRIETAVLVRLVQLPQLRHLSLARAFFRGYGTCLENEHVVAMANALYESNGHLEYMDLSRHDFGQEGWEALFRLVEHDPNIQIEATAYYTDRAQATFLLRDRDAVDQHLQRQEVDRSLRLRDAGFARLLTDPNATRSDWVDLLQKMSEDSIAVFHILRANPMICSIKTKKRKRSD